MRKIAGATKKMKPRRKKATKKEKKIEKTN